jgi:hypothetical protein
MAYVSVPKDMSKVKVKLLFGLTKRQIFCFLPGAAIGVPLFFLLRGTLGNQVAMIVMVVVMLPAFFMGMYEKDGLPAEIIVRNFIRSQFLWPGVRLYRTENLFEYLEKDEVNHIGTEKKPGATGAKAAHQKRRGGK